MSGIYIPDIEMPKKNNIMWLTMSWDGRVIVQAEKNGEFDTEKKLVKAIEISTHGDLIDRSLALGACHEMARSLDMEGAFEVIENAPAVIPASEG